MKRSFRILSILLLICTQIFFFSGIHFKAYANESSSANKVVKTSDGNSFLVFNAEEENPEEDENDLFKLDKSSISLEYCYNAGVFKHLTNYRNSKNLFLLSTPLYKSFSFYKI